MKVIYLIRLGPGDPQAVTLQTLDALKEVRRVYVRTARHPGLAILKKWRIPYKPLDFFYRQSATFEDTYRNIANYIVKAAMRHGSVAYAVPGSPFFAEKTVELISKKAANAGISTIAIPAVSFLEAIRSELRFAHEEEILIIDALQPEKAKMNPHRHKLVIQAYNKQRASAVKLALLDVYPPEHTITAIRGAGLARGKRKRKLPLYKMDRLSFIDHLTTFYIPPLTAYGVDDLVAVMQKLRGEGGCPWDKEQDHQTLKPYLLEEAYEVLGAIDSANLPELCEELGDLLLQVVFHSVISSENSEFTFYDVTNRITEKLIRRHPHVFGDEHAKTADDVLKSWQQIKKAEKAGQESLFKLEMYLPALLRAQKLQRHASTVGFDWPDLSGAWDKLQEELGELQDAYKSGQEVKIEEELGDLLFAVVNVARFMKVDAEQALGASTQKFFRRLRFVEEQARAQGGEMLSYSLSKLDEWWEQAKKRLDT